MSLWAVYRALIAVLLLFTWQGIEGFRGPRRELTTGRCSR